MRCKSFNRSQFPFHLCQGQFTECKAIISGLLQHQRVLNVNSQNEIMVCKCFGNFRFLLQGKKNMLILLMPLCGCTTLCGIQCFIALIHPIQWTIANPVGADRPAKRQKKTSCVSTGQAGPVLCTRQMACRTSFLSRQREVTASFLFGMVLCTRNFICDWIFESLVRISKVLF